MPRLDVPPSMASWRRRRHRLPAARTARSSRAEGCRGPIRRKLGPMTGRFVPRGFVGRRGAGPEGSGGGEVASRIPPGQYLTTDFPVLSAGPTPRTPLDQWSFYIEGLVPEPGTWTWDEFTPPAARHWTP